MLTGNKFYKLNDQAEVVKVTTDDIPEGEFNKYCLNYADGKILGDIVLRPTPKDTPCHRRLDGSILYEYEYKEFYDLCLQNKQLAQEDEAYSYFNKTQDEYDEFLLSHTITDELGQQLGSYCPYFVLSTDIRNIYEVTRDGLIGYTSVPGDADTEVQTGYIYDTEYLQHEISVCDDWYYTGTSFESTVNYVKLPTYIVHTDDSVTNYHYFIVVKSRVTDETTSIRSVSLGRTESLQSDQQAYVRNVGTLQNLVLDFGIPCGVSGTIYVGEVETGDIASVENVGTESEAVFNFVLPRGEQGIAGGVVVLKAVVEELPTDLTAASADKYFLTTENIIYTYNGSEWVEDKPADMGLIYLVDGKIYYYNGQSLVSTHAETTIDNVTIQKDENGSLQTVAMKTVQGSIIYDWVGTLKEWEQGRANGTILDTYICFVIDD